MWIIWALLSAIFAAMTAIFAKLGTQQMDSDFATLIRTSIILLILICFVWGTGKLSNPMLLSTKNWFFLGLSALATGASWICYFRALQLGDVARVAPVDKLSVIFVAVFAVCFLGERLDVRDWFAVSLVAAGVIILAIKR